MARIQKDKQVKEEVERMKKDVVQVAASATRRRWLMRAGCCFAPVLLLLALLAYLAWIAAATGLVAIPGVSRFAYERPEPAREVQARGTLETSIASKLEAEVTARLRRGGGSLENRDITLALSEQAFTGTLRTLLDESEISAFASANAQTAVREGEGLEVFLPLADNAQDSALIIGLAIVPDEEGGLGFDVLDVRIGALDLPGFIGDLLVEPAVMNSFRSFNEEFGRFARIEEVRFHGTEAIFSGEITVEVLELQSL